MLQDHFISKKVKTWILASASLFTTVLLVLLFSYSRINEDSTFYLGVSRLIGEGLVPYHDFALSYTPLTFYIQKVFMSLFGYTFAVGLAVMFIAHIVNSFLVYKISTYYTESRFIAAIVALLSLLLCLFTEGNDYDLEPFVLLFGLAGLLVLQRKITVPTVLASAVLCCASFMCKQYGLGFLLLCMAFVLLKGEFSRKSILLALALLGGFLSATVITVFLFVQAGINISELFSMSGSGYDRHGISDLVDGILYIMANVPFLIVPLILLVRNLKNIGKYPMLVVSFLGIGGFLLCCYVRFYPHYTMLAMPFCALSFVTALPVVEDPKWSKRYLTAVLVSLLIPASLVGWRAIDVTVHKERAVQYDNAARYEEYVSTGTGNVFASSSLLYVTLINEYNPPLMKKYGLSNGFVERPHELLELIQAADYCLVTDVDFMDEYRYNSEVLQYLQDNFDKKVVCENHQLVNLYLFSRKNIE